MTRRDPVEQDLVHRGVVEPRPTAPGTYVIEALAARMTTGLT